VVTKPIQLRSGERLPFTEPDVMPATISRLKKMYVISIGMVMVTAAK
jgi:hypothetical protein